MLDARHPKRAAADVICASSHAWLYKSAVPTRTLGTQRGSAACMLFITSGAQHGLPSCAHRARRHFDAAPPLRRLHAHDPRLAERGTMRRTTGLVALLAAAGLLAATSAEPAAPLLARLRGQSRQQAPARQQAHMQPPAALTPAPTMHRQAAGGTTGLPDSFVKVNAGRLVIGEQCKEFYFAGWNMWTVVELGSNAPSPPFRSTPKKGQEHLVNVLNQGVAAGMKVVRMWAHSITPGWEMQTGPATYDEKVLKGMDFVMDECHKRGLKVIWVFADNWYPTGGIDSFVKMGGSSKHQDFFTSASIKALYKQHISFMANRVNSINGRKYSEDPTIMAWNLANEARCQNCGSAPMQGWISEMCQHVKSVAPKQLVGIGYEGFYGPDSGKQNLNPADWASREGQNFVTNSQDPCIDYVGMHVWPDNWGLKTPEFQKAFIENHLRDVATAIKGKPVILEEFGKITEDSAQTVRNKYFVTAHAVAEENAKTGGPLMGTLFWHWYDEGMGPGQYGVHKSDSTWPLITRHVDFFNALFDKSRDLCPA